MTDTTTPTTAFPGTGGNTAAAGGFTFDPSAYTSSVITGASKTQANKQVYAPSTPGSATVTKMSVGDWVKSILAGGDLTALYTYVPELQQTGYLSANTGADGVFNPKEIIAALVEAGGSAADAGVPVIDFLQSVQSAAAASRQAGGSTRFVRGGNVQEALSNPDVVHRIGDAVGQQLMGRKLHPDEVQSIVDNLHTQEGTKAASDIAAAQASAAQYAMSVQGGAVMNGASLDGFMKAIGGTEDASQNPNATNGRTGAAGLFQILPSNWSKWSAAAGMPGAPFTPQNQQIVAAHQMQDYYNKYHSWQAVAVAWYGGEHTADNYVSNPTNPAWDKKQGPTGKEPSINEYVQSVMSKMGGAPAPTPGSTTVGSPTSFQTPTGTVNVLAPQLTTYTQPADPESAADAFIRNQRPTEYQANNLFNGFQTLDQAFREGVTSRAAQPANTGGSL